MNKKMSAEKVYLIYAGATAFFFSLVFTVSQIYRIEVANLNALQLVLVGTALEAATFVFEIPTGIVADIYSRRLSIIIGLNLIGIGFLLEGALPMYITIIIAQVLWGVGYTFLSGADEAWIADEMGNENIERIYLRGAQIGQIFALLGILISTALGVVMINLPILIGGALFIMLSIVLLIIMPENEFVPTLREDRNSFGKMGDTFVMGIRSIKGSKLLIVMLFVSLLYGLYSEGIDRLWNAHFLEDVQFPAIVSYEPVIWFGIITTVAMVLSIIVVELIKRRMDRTKKLEMAWLLVVLNVGFVAAIIAFGFSGNFITAFTSYLALYIIRKTNYPIYRAWLNKNIKPKVRATVLSTYGQIDAFGQIVGGPIIGYIAYKTSISIGIISAGIILAPVILLYIYAGRRGLDKNIENTLQFKVD